MRKLAAIALLSACVSTPALAFDVAAKYNQACMACHMVGVAGAPKAFDPAAWEPKLAQGMDTLLNSVKNGKGAMPAGGLCMDCTDDQYQQLINYMAAPAN